jgi:glycosyltransferase involved in cell wall biosynthesis
VGLGDSSPLGLRSPVAALKRLGVLVRVLRARRPAVVHGFLFSAYVLGAIAARLARVPIVVASRRSAGFFKAARPFWLWIERLTNRWTDHVVANSEAVRDDVVRQEGIPGETISVIYNGVDVPVFTDQQLMTLRSTLDVDGRHPIIVVVANLIAYKGHDLLFKALPPVLSAFPRLAVLLVGDGIARTHFQEQARSAGLGSVVRFLGVREDVPMILALADVVVHPSRHEGFSNAVLEAMAAARPIVASAVGGNVEAIVDGETGVLVPPDDADALGAAVLRLLRTPPEAARLGEAARARVEERFTIDAMVRAYERTYDRLVAVHGTTGRPVERDKGLPDQSRNSPW